MRRNVMTGITMVGLATGITAMVWFVQTPAAQAHCQVPCGIYDDGARIVRLHEDADTIAKAMTNINELSGKNDAQSLNQAIRWINTKEMHGTHIIDVVSEYFLTQKVKPKAPGSPEYNAYLSSLADHHAVMVAAMKAKQSADPARASSLHSAIDALGKHYKK